MIHAEPLVTESELESGEVKQTSASSQYHSLEVLPLATTTTEEEEEPIIHQSKTIFLVTAFGLCVAFWLLSGGLTLFNKWFFSHHGFPFPILFIMCTMVMHTLITQIIVRLMLPGSYRQTVPQRVFCVYLLPIAFCSALEIATSNLALVKLSVSFHTMVHASKPVFFAIWSVVLGLERANWQIAGIVSLVAFGVLLLSLGESLTQRAGQEKMETFDMLSFWLILFSCFISGLRWNVAQLMLQRISIGSETAKKEKLTPINLSYYTSPFSALSLLPFFLLVELERFIKYVQRDDVDIGEDLFGFGVLISIWALVMTLVEFYFVKQTSALMFSMAAILKELGVITLAIILHGDTLPALNVLGFIFCIAGVVAYQRYKFSKYEEIKQ